jgi:hypothetical protein
VSSSVFVVPQSFVRLNFPSNLVVSEQQMVKQIKNKNIFLFFSVSLKKEENKVEKNLHLVVKTTDD